MGLQPQIERDIVVHKIHRCYAGLGIHTIRASPQMP